MTPQARLATPESRRCGMSMDSRVTEGGDEEYGLEEADDQHNPLCHSHPRTVQQHPQMSIKSDIAARWMPGTNCILLYTYPNFSYLYVRNLDGQVITPFLASLSPGSANAFPLLIPVKGNDCTSLF